MNASFDYDEKADVLYISLGTGEPSFTDDADDSLLVDVGMYSGQPTGFTLLHVRERNISEVQVRLHKVIRQFKKAPVRTLPAAAEVFKRLEEAISELPERARELIPA